MRKIIDHTLAFIHRLFGMTGVIIAVVLLVLLLWGILIMLPIIGWAIALIMTSVIIISFVSFRAGRKSKE